MSCLVEVHDVLTNLRSRLNARAHAAALSSQQHMVTSRRWNRLLKGTAQKEPRIGFYEGTMLLACADYQLWIATTLIRADTHFRDIANTIKTRGLGSLRAAALDSGVCPRSYSYYKSSREPEIWAVLRMADKLPSGAELRRVDNWFWGWASTQSSTGPAPLAQDPNLWRAIAEDRLSGATREELARAYGTTPAEIDRVCEWTKTQLPGFIDVLLGRSRKKPKKPKK